MYYILNQNTRWFSTVSLLSTDADTPLIMATRKSRNHGPRGCSRRCSVGRCGCCRHHHLALEEVRFLARSGRTLPEVCPCPSAHGHSKTVGYWKRVWLGESGVRHGTSEAPSEEDLRAASRANVMSVSHPSVRTRSSSTLSSSRLGAVAVLIRTRMSFCLQVRPRVGFSNRLWRTYRVDEAGSADKRD